MTRPVDRARGASLSDVRVIRSPLEGARAKVLPRTLHSCGSCSSTASIRTTSRPCATHLRESHATNATSGPWAIRPTQRSRRNGSVPAMARCLSAPGAGCSPSRRLWFSSVAANAQFVVAEVVEVAVGAAGFVAGHAADAAVDRLPLELPPAAWTSATMSRRANSVAPVRWWSRLMASRMAFLQLAVVGELGLQRWDGDGGPLMAVWRFALCRAKSTNPSEQRFCRIGLRRYCTRPAACHTL